jgi:hydrogenase maturation protease
LKNKNLNIDKSLRMLVVGFGSEILKDDGIALKIIDDLKLEADLDFVDFEEVNLISLETLELLLEYKVVILIDAALNNDQRVGTVNHYHLKDFKESLHLVNFHDLSINQLIEFAKTLKMAITDNIHIITIVVSEVEEFGFRLSEMVNEIYPVIYSEIYETMEVLIKENLILMKSEVS